MPGSRKLMTSLTKTWFLVKDQQKIFYIQEFIHTYKAEGCILGIQSTVLMKNSILVQNNTLHISYWEYSIMKMTMKTDW